MCLWFVLGLELVIERVRLTVKVMVMIGADII